jgi:hypothetical protein
VKLSDYDQALLAQIGHFADTWLAEQVRAVMVARNNAEATVADTEAKLVEVRETYRDWVRSARLEERAEAAARREATRAEAS